MRFRLIFQRPVIWIYLLITSAELGIYEEWKTKLNFKALKYLSNPDEVYNSTVTSTFFLIIGLLIIQYVIFILFYIKYIHSKKVYLVRKVYPMIIFFCIGSVLLFIGIRGGFMAIPINQSQSYYSKHNILNLAAVNSGYNLIMSTLESYKVSEENPFMVMDMEKAEKIVNRLYQVEKDTTIRVLTTERPNILLIMLESWSADVIEAITGEKGITPRFNSLVNDGILFTEAYVTGNRSEQSMVSIFGGFPATPIVSLSHNLDKISKLPSLIKILNREGYNTSFYFGGQLIYGGIRSYLLVNEFDLIIEQKDFDKDLPQGKLGYHDEYVFDRFLSDLITTEEPFFSVVFTQSSHSPYDQPKSETIQFAELENEYLNSVYYTDGCLGDFMDGAKKQDWYDNTLFIIVADHSHTTHKDWSVLSKEYRRIPLFFYGNVIKEEFRGTKTDRITSQNDIATSILKQMNLDADEFTWSRNLFNPTTQEFAYFEATDGIGWITPNGHYTYYRRHNNYYQMEIPENIKDSIITDGKAYLQVLFQEYINY
jgi:phosphoglycerol transferase MdoB-like AlkP superfamily enzyme